MGHTLDISRVFMEILVQLVKSAHDIQLLHRDIKPDNCFYDDKVGSSLVDWGSSCSVDHHHRSGMREGSIGLSVGPEELIVGKGAGVNAKSNLGRTLLYRACYQGHLEITEWLLENGAEVHAKDDAGAAPLLWACYNGHLETAKALMNKWADIDATKN
ncbi:MAG: hypothetical protein SGBAC_003202, partial [Bacillariaceae sp.]